ncbi:unnamed protein product [Ceutorhynchus assimilis]|uniref:Uncharacterized protein n=1 Tax=Ceutorhynchus assimilis TaxID=467358 RepID=A0A9N9MWD3_9CUCU|nr:unnamed protein product [Ceutorhynchus assimilis]
MGIGVSGNSKEETLSHNNPSMDALNMCDGKDFSIEGKGAEARRQKRSPRRTGKKPKKIKKISTRRLGTTDATTVTRNVTRNVTTNVTSVANARRLDPLSQLFYN